jgi:hypothetical protein
MGGRWGRMLLKVKVRSTAKMSSFNECDLIR